MNSHDISIDLTLILMPPSRSQAEVRAMQSDAGERHRNHRNPLEVKCLKHLETKSTCQLPFSDFQILLPSHGLSFRHGTSASVHRVRKLVSGHGIDVVALGLIGKPVENRCLMV